MLRPGSGHVAGSRSSRCTPLARRGAASPTRSCGRSWSAAPLLLHRLHVGARQKISGCPWPAHYLGSLFRVEPFRPKMGFDPPRTTRGRGPLIVWSGFSARAPGEACLQARFDPSHENNPDLRNGTTDWLAIPGISRIRTRPRSSRHPILTMEKTLSSVRAVLCGLRGY